MEDGSLLERLEGMKSQPPLTDEKRKKASKKLDELLLLKESNSLEINVLKRIMENNNEKNVKIEILKKDYNQIVKEYSKIYDLISNYFSNKIKIKIKKQKEDKKWPSEYFPIIEDEIFNKRKKIMEFFTFNKYLNRRRYNLDTNYLIFIKDMALKNEAYEFLETLKEN